MKKILLIFVLICIIGCTKKEESIKIIKEEPKSLYELAVANSISNGKIVCPELTEGSVVSEFSYNLDDTYFFSTNNNVYNINYSKLFSNDTNCVLRYTFTDNRKVLYFDDSLAYLDDNFKYSTNDNTFYKLGTHSIKKEMQIVTIEREYKDRVTLMYDGIEFFEIGKTISYWSDSGNNSANFDTSAINGEKIINIYSGNVLKTDKAFYTIKSEIVNDDCKNYVDKECQYKYSLVKNNLLTKYYNEILTIVNDRIITNNYEVISLSNILEHEK